MRSAPGGRVEPPGLLAPPRHSREHTADLGGRTRRGSKSVRGDHGEVDEVGHREGEEHPPHGRPRQRLAATSRASSSGTIVDTAVMSLVTWARPNRSPAASPRRGPHRRSGRRADQNKRAQPATIHSVAGVSIITPGRPAAARTGRTRGRHHATAAGARPAIRCTRSTASTTVHRAQHGVDPAKRIDQLEEQAVVARTTGSRARSTTNDPIGCRKNGSPNCWGSVPCATSSATSA